MALTKNDTGGTLLLIRHGQTHANIDQIWHGVTDTPLTDEGRFQAQRMGRHVHSTYSAPSTVYASQLQRAVHTAGELGREVVSDPRLQEMDNGEWEETDFRFLQGEHDFFKRFSTEDDFCAPGGESRADVLHRMLAVLSEIAETHADETVAVVSHGIAISVTLAHLELGDSSQWVQYNPHNTGVSVLRIPKLELLDFNLTEHLD